MKFFNWFMGDASNRLGILLSIFSILPVSILFAVLSAISPILAVLWCICFLSPFSILIIRFLFKDDCEKYTDIVLTFWLNFVLFSAIIGAILSIVLIPVYALWILLRPKY